MLDHFDAIDGWSKKEEGHIEQLELLTPLMSGDVKRARVADSAQQCWMAGSSSSQVRPSLHSSNSSSAAR